MFRPVQNPDDEEVEGRVRTRTRTKELVGALSSRQNKIPPLSTNISHTHTHFFRTFDCDPVVFQVSSPLSFSVVLVTQQGIDI